MKSKRVLSFLLAAVMVFTAFAAGGCAKKNNNDENETSGIVALNMFIMTEDETSPSAAREVQMAINEITVPKYKMLIKINYLKPDEYWAAVDAAEDSTINYVADEIALLDAEAADSTDASADTTADASGDTAADASADTAADTTTKTDKPVVKDVSQMTFNEAIDYVFDIDDITLSEPQIDVFVVDDYDKFLELADDERLAEIDIKYDRKVLTKYIHPTILSTTSIDGKTYGVPANFKMEGKYEFLVFNKDLLDKYHYSVHDLRKIEDMGDYLSLIKANEPGYYPISDLPEMAGAEIYDGILFSLSKLTQISASSYPVYLNNSAYADYLKKTASYRQKGYVASANGVTNAKYAIEYVTSDHLIDREWTDENGTSYQAYLYDIPRVTAKEAFKSAMCVSAYSIHKSKAAELIELFNTDSELANLLQYGISGKHYREENGIVTYIDTDAENTYRMNNFLTGNTYIKYTTEENADYVEKAKETNLGTAPSAYFGFQLNFDDVDSKSIYECVKIFSTEALKRVQNGEMTVDEVFNIAGRELNALGAQWNSDGSALLGVFGKLATQQKTSAEKNTSYFVVSEQVETYNDIYKSAEEIAAELAAQEQAEEEAKAEKAAEEEAALEAEIAAEDAAAKENADNAGDQAAADAAAEADTASEADAA